METLIENSGSPDDAMRQIAAEAEKSGLIPDAETPRQTSPMAFVMDVLADNPAALDWLNLHRDEMPAPLQINDLPTLLDAIR